MIFTRKNPNEYNLWFAWFPVKIGGRSDYIWLEQVYRMYDYDNGHYEYRATGAQLKRLKERE